ncbi:hypothetical protein RE628_20070 [Paenibacillus sp. D2_2]|uniref:hypothetical protein n=1 Tax=Paenibacillus sp. D2_2 TaxID=3073092 RepID=UPI0028150588|nr:hypothetical protein [Paenibacillus sp. D2_2]WMT39679.1 hypothetical protein RE628_20070 [Paenibacillus sp. D2_2]
MITVLFWPFMIASIICSILGVLIKSHQSLYVSAILIIPMSIYIAGWPIFLIWGLLLPLCYVGAAKLIRKNKRLLSILACMPVYLVIGWIGYVVLSQ